MRTPSSNFRAVSLLAALAIGLAACDGSGTGIERLTPDQVGGTYEVCSLVFSPQQSLLPPVDVRAAVIDTSPQARLRAGLLLSNSATTFELGYTTLANEIRTLNGNYQLGASTVSLTFSATAQQRAALLLPNRVDLDFQAQPKQLTTLATPATYAVPRADYARLAGADEAGLANEIPGTLSARFAVGSCE